MDLSRSVLLVVNGVSFSMQSGNKLINNIHSLKVVALGADGKELESFTSTNLALSLTVNASEQSHIKSITSTNADVSVIGYGKVDSIVTQNGNISVEKVEGNVKTVQSQNGNLSIKADNVINATTMNGNIIKK